MAPVCRHIFRRGRCFQIAAAPFAELLISCSARIRKISSPPYTGLSGWR